MSFSDISQTSQQNCCLTAARMLQVSKVVAPTSWQALISHFVSPYLEYKQIVFRRRKFACYASHKTVHAASDDSSFHFFKGAFNTATKCVQKRVQQDSIFKLKVQLLSEKFIDLKVNIQYFCYIYVLHIIFSASQHV